MKLWIFVTTDIHITLHDCTTFQEIYEEAMTEEEREAASTALTEASDWLEWEMEGEPAPEVKFLPSVKESSLLFFGTTE